MAGDQGWFKCGAPSHWVKEDDAIDGKITARLNGLRGPIFEVVLYGLAAFTAFWGAAHSADVLRGLGHFAWPTSPDFNGSATSFVGLFIATSLAYGLQRFALRVEREAQDRTQGNYQQQLKDAQDELVRKSDRLEHLVRTMPPTDFLEFASYRFAKSENDVATLLVLPHEQRTADILKSALRVVLDNFAEVARAFDGKPSEAYHANIMTYHPPSEIAANTQFKHALSERLLFPRFQASINKNQGVLDLRTDLAIVTTNEPESGVEPDSVIRPVALAIPDPLSAKIEGQKKYYTLPGAPIAWTQRKADGYAKTDELLDWYKRKCVRDEDVEQNIREYFQDESLGIGSLTSFALMFNEEKEDDTVLPSKAMSNLLLKTEAGFQFATEDTLDGNDLDGNDEAPIGVLNLHRKSPGILKGDERAGPYFVSATRPFRILCTRLLYLLRAVERQSRENEAKDEGKG